MENVVLYGPGGASPVNVGSWLLADPGPDYGARGLLTAIEAESFGDGGAFVYERAGIRRMGFPLMLPSGGAGLSLTQLESLVRLNARPGGYIDVQPDGVPSAEAVRFDIVHGRWEPAHSIPVNRAARRPGSLQLDTQPFGYWPTWITLASVASMGLHAGGRLSVATTLAAYGDVPALVELTIVPTAATQMASGGAGPDAFYTDAVAWSNGGRPSFAALLPGGSWLLRANGTYIQPDSGGFSPARTFSPTLAKMDFGPALSDTWFAAAFYVIPSSLEPAYRGRFRAFAQVYPNATRITQVLVDVVQSASMAPLLSMASAGLVATCPASGGANMWPILDVGDITLPAAASGVQSEQALRLVLRTGSWGATTTPIFGGIYLLPLDGEAGVVTRGLAFPSYGNATANTFPAAVQLRQDIGVNAYVGTAALGDMRQFYRGQMPRLGASVQQFDILGLQRRLGGPSSAVDLWSGTAAYAAASVRYRPRFQFLKGI